MQRLSLKFLILHFWGSAPEHTILRSIRTFHMLQLWYHLQPRSTPLVVFKATLLRPFIYVLPMQKFSG